VADKMQTMTVSIWREDGDDGRFEKYEVPARENQTVLDVVAYVQQHIDPAALKNMKCQLGKIRRCLMLWLMSNSILTPLYLIGLPAALACADHVR